MVAGRGQHNRKENNRERKAEQEADIGGAPGAERPGQLPLHRIARDLPQRRRDGKGNPDHGEQNEELIGEPRIACTVKLAARAVNRNGVMTGLRSAPSPHTSRGKGWGEGPLYTDSDSWMAPSPGLLRNPTSPRKPGEVKLNPLRHHHV